MMIKKYIGLYSYFHLKNARIPKRNWAMIQVRLWEGNICGDTLKCLETIFQAHSKFFAP